VGGHLRTNSPKRNRIIGSETTKRTTFKPEVDAAITGCFRVEFLVLQRNPKSKRLCYRPELQSDIPSVTLNGTEMAVLAILKQKPDSSRGEIAEKISKTVRTVQRALDSLRDKGYIQRVGSKQDPQWKILK